MPMKHFLRPPPVVSGGSHRNHLEAFSSMNIVLRAFLGTPLPSPPLPASTSERPQRSGSSSAASTRHPSVPSDNINDNKSIDSSNRGVLASSISNSLTAVFNLLSNTVALQNSDSDETNEKSTNVTGPTTTRVCSFATPSQHDARKREVSESLHVRDLQIAFLRLLDRMEQHLKRPEGTRSDYDRTKFITFFSVLQDHLSVLQLKKSSLPSSFASFPVEKFERRLLFLHRLLAHLPLSSHHIGLDSSSSRCASISIPSIRRPLKDDDLTFEEKRSEKNLKFFVRQLVARTPASSKATDVQEKTPSGIYGIYDDPSACGAAEEDRGLSFASTHLYRRGQEPHRVLAALSAQSIDADAAEEKVGGNGDKAPEFSSATAHASEAYQDACGHAGDANYELISASTYPQQQSALHNRHQRNFQQQQPQTATLHANKGKDVAFEGEDLEGSAIMHELSAISDVFLQKAREINTALKVDAVVLDATEQLLEQQQPKMKETNARLQKHIDDVRWNCCGSFCIILVVSVVWFATFIVMKIFPKP